MEASGPVEDEVPAEDAAIPQHQPPSSNYEELSNLAALWDANKRKYVEAYLIAIRNGMPKKNAVNAISPPECGCIKHVFRVQCYLFFGNAFITAL
ncbi:hypothetical protein MBANPS3_003801, partial [Mucor bainieri]